MNFIEAVKALERTGQPIGRSTDNEIVFSRDGTDLAWLDRNSPIPWFRESEKKE